MKKITPWAVVYGIIAFLAVAFASLASMNNHLVWLDEQVNESWGQVQNVYKRRSDLIPNLVNTVKGYAKHEAAVLEEVTQARARVGEVRVQGPQDLQKFDQAQAQLGGALSRLLVVAERYPELKANQNFLELQSQLEGTENRITVERMRFNQATRAYNTYVRRFPSSLVASFRGFQQRPYFAAEPASQQAPNVEF